MTTDRNSEGAVYQEHCSERGWVDIAKDDYEAWAGDASIQVQGFSYRILYTTPPASIPAAEVQALVERIQEQADTNRIGAHNALDGWEGLLGKADALDEVADELAKLIPRGK